MNRDYNLEANDDAAQFDLGNDLSMFWVARRQAEEIWEDKARLYEVFRTYGIRNEQHFYQVQATVDRFIAGVRLENSMQDANAFHSVIREYDIRDKTQGDRLIATAQRFAPHPAQRQRFGHDLGNIAQMQANALQQYEMQKMQSRAKNELKGELSPVEGVSLSDWALAQARLASGGDLGQILGQLGVDAGRWERVSAEWMARMSRDQTATIATEYGKAFSNAGQGQFGAAAQQGVAGMTSPGSTASQAPPITLEQWVEIQEAQSAASRRGQDVSQVLAHYGMNPLAWSNASMWWSTHFSQNAMNNGGELHRRFSELSAYFQQRFAG
jgi:hypothetical protein